jgi:uncharacterized protein YjbI with pentapeptide repeats
MQPGFYWNGHVLIAPSADVVDKTIRDHKLWIDSNGEKGARADFNHTNLINFNLEGVTLTGAQLEGVILAGSNLTNAELGFARLNNQGTLEPGDPTAYLPAPPIMLTASIIDQNGHIVSTMQPVPGATNLSRAFLTKVIFTGADLSDAILSKAILSGADLTRADLHGADLSGADLTAAILDGSDMSDANLDGTIFEPASISPVTSIENAKNLDLLTFRSNPDLLIQIRQRFEQEGLTAQAREITYAINQRQTQLDPRTERWFRIVAFDLTCRYGMDPGRPLRIIASLWVIFFLSYIVLLHWKRCFRVRITRYYWRRDKTREFAMWSPPPPFQMTSKKKSVKTWLRFERRAALSMMFFSLANAFNLGYREFNIGQWLRMLTKRQYDVKAVGWVRSLAGLQSLVSIYLFALWILTYFGHPFD